MASSVKVTSPYPDNSAALEPLAGIRPQIQDLRTENIAVLAQLAANVGDVIPLWYGEGDITTPAFIRDAASALLEAGNTFYVPNMRGLGVLNEALSIYQSGIHGRDIPIGRTTAHLRVMAFGWPRAAPDPAFVARSTSRVAAADGARRLGAARESSDKP